MSNWSRRTFDLARPRFAFLDWFTGIVISGDVRVVKPDERIYRTLLDRYALAPTHVVFIDDRKANVHAAERLGMRGILYRDPPSLRRELAELGLLRA